MTHSEYLASRKRQLVKLKEHGVKAGSDYPQLSYVPGKEWRYLTQLDAMQTHIERLNKEKNGR